MRLALCIGKYSVNHSPSWMYISPIWWFVAKIPTEMVINWLFRSKNSKLIYTPWKRWQGNMHKKPPKKKPEGELGNKLWVEMTSKSFLVINQWLITFSFIYITQTSFPLVCSWKIFLPLTFLLFSFKDWNNNNNNHFQKKKEIYLWIKSVYWLILISRFHIFTLKYNNCRD